MGSPKTTEEELTMVTSFVKESMIRWGGRMEWRFDGHEMDFL
jgi:exonuclease V gamma subunit